MSGATWELDDMPDQKGRTFLVTGVTSGRLGPICSPGGMKCCASGLAAGFWRDARRRSSVRLTDEPPCIMLIIWPMLGRDPGLIPAPNPLLVATSTQ